LAALCRGEDFFLAGSAGTGPLVLSGGVGGDEDMVARLRDVLGPVVSVHDEAAGA
jgi:hypothetical protein